MKAYLSYQHQYAQLDNKKSIRLNVNLEFGKGQYLNLHYLIYMLQTWQTTYQTVYDYDMQMIPLFKKNAR